MMSFLVVEDEPAVQRAVVRALRPFAPSLVAASVAEAHATIDRTSVLTGAVVDVGLRDGSGMMVVGRLRARKAALPVMVLTGRLAPNDVNAAQLLRAEYVIKGTPHVGACLRDFGLRARAATNMADARTANVIALLAARVGLTAGEVAVLGARVGGTTAIATAHVLGITERAVRAHIERMLAKTRHDRMEDLVSDVLRDALAA